MKIPYCSEQLFWVVQRRCFVLSVSGPCALPPATPTLTTWACTGLVFP